MPTAALVLAKVQQMHAALRTQAIPLKYNPHGDFQGRMMGHDRSLELGTQWFPLPEYSFGGPIAWRGGDKFGCLVHELSHNALDTRDIRINRKPKEDGGSDRPEEMVYGGIKCRNLARGRPALAFENADNWGFFIEEFCAFQTFESGGRTRSGHAV